MATLPYWNNDEVISSDKLNSMVQAIINGDPLAVKVSNATKNDVNQIVDYLSSLYNSAKTNLNSATSTSAFGTAYTNMTALVSNKLGSYANDDTVDLYSTGIRASIIAFLQAYDNMMSNDRLNNKNTDNTIGSRIDSEATDRENADNAINNKIYDMQTNGGGRNLLRISSFNGDTTMFNTYWHCGNNTAWNFSDDKPITSDDSRSLKFTPKSNLPNVDNGIWYIAPQVKAGEVYTFSFWGKSTSDGFTMEVESFSDISKFTMTTAWKYYSGQLKFASDNRNMYFRVSEDNSATVGTVTIFQPMLEKGTVAHDWQPAPEDINSYIENVNAKTDANTASISKITSNGGGINLLKDTDKMTNTNYWGLRGGQLSKAYYGNENPANKAGVALSDYNVECSTKTSFIDYIPQITFEQGTDYTVSFWTTNVITPLLYLNTDDGDNHQHWGSSQTISLQASDREYSGWRQVTATFKPSLDTAYLTFGISTNADNTVSRYRASSFKLEKGIIAHDWSPNPYDVQSQLDGLNTNKISSSDVNWNLVAKNSSNTYNYASGSIITFPNNSSITINENNNMTSHIYLPMYFTDYTPNTDFNALATSGECDNLFITSATMATLTNRPTNPDTGVSLTGDCFYTCHYAYSGTTVRAFQKIYSCDYNYTFTRSYNGSSQSWTNWSCLTPYA